MKKKNISPRARIAELAEQFRLGGIDPGWCIYPSTEDFVNAIIAYLDEEMPKLTKKSDEKVIKKEGEK